MSVLVEIKGRRQSARTPARDWPLIAAAFPLLILLLLPLVALLRYTPATAFLHFATSSGTTQAISLSLGTSAVASLFVLVLGLPLAYLLARQRSRLGQLIEVLIDLPTVLPPAVAGLALLMVFGRKGLLGPALDGLGIQVAFTSTAVIIAQIFVASPYFIKSAALGLAAIGPELEQAAQLDGANPRQIFQYVMLPLAWRGIIGGIALSWARALGEFGATIIFAGNYPGRTQTMPLAVYLGFEIDLNQALTLAAILLVLSFGILFAVRATLRNLPTNY
ncbi:MAG TPA: ABC transporter permease [Anaerolineae bacterium]